MLYGTKEPPVTFMNGNALKEGLNLFYVLKIEYRNVVLSRGTQHLVKIIWPSAQNLTQNILTPPPRQPAQPFYLVAVLVSAAVPHLSDRYGQGVFILFPILPNVHFFFSNGSLNIRLTKALSLPPLAHLELPSDSIDFLINPWEKRCQNSIKDQLHWFSITKEHLVHVLTDGCVCYSWSFTPTWLQRRLVSLPSLWQPQEVCNHLLQWVKSPLTSRAHPLDLRMR
jgi:hypothetical protein